MLMSNLYIPPIQPTVIPHARSSSHYLWIIIWRTKTFWKRTHNDANSATIGPKTKINWNTHLEFLQNGWVFIVLHCVNEVNRDGINVVAGAVGRDNNEAEVFILEGLVHRRRFEAQLGAKMWINADLKTST